MREIMKTHPGIYHIHIDSQILPEKLEKYAKEALGFQAQDFTGNPYGYEHFNPVRHLTLKTSDRGIFNSVWYDLEEKAAEFGLVGYLEGEYILTDDFIPYKQYREIAFPFKVYRRVLSGNENEQFRQTEIHLGMDKDASNPKLIKNLLDAGLYGVYLPKNDHTSVIFTIQGFVKNIRPLKQALLNYLRESGGVESCTLKEEVAVRYALFGISPKELPEIADKIKYYESDKVSANI